MSGFLSGLFQGLGGAIGQGVGGSLFGGNQQQDRFGYSLSNAGGSVSGGGQASSVTNPDFVFGPQVPYLEQLWGAGAGLLGQGGNQDQVQGIFDQAWSTYDRILNPQSNPLLGIYAQDLNRELEQQLMPAIRSDMAAFGQLGGDRQGVAEGLLAGEAYRNLQNFAGQQYQADMDRMLSALGQMPSFGAFGLGIPWHGLNQFAGILGPAIRLGGGGSSQESRFNVGSDFSTSETFDSTNRGDIFGPGGVRPLNNDGGGIGTSSRPNRGGNAGGGGGGGF